MFYCLIEHSVFYCLIEHSVFYCLIEHSVCLLSDGIECVLLFHSVLLI